MKLLTGLLLLLTFSAYAESAMDIIAKAEKAAYYQGKDGMGQMLMKVYSSDKAKPIKKMFYMLRINDGNDGKQRFFTYFTSPSDIKRTTFLVHKFVDKDDFRRLYIPSSDKVIAIAGSRKQDPFMGSDFAYEDVSGRNIHHDNHKLLGSEKVAGDDCYIVENTPMSKYASNDKYSKIKAWIRKSDYITMKVEYYNKAGKLWKVYTSEKIKTIAGFPTILKRNMRTVTTGTHTVILVNPKKVRYNVGFTKDLFTERSLKNPPMQYLK
jgi:outer membrane lipoprotein-sorting protein